MLKKWLFLLLIFLASTSPAFAYPPMGAWCLNPSGSWIPVAMSAIGTIYPGTPPSTGIYGSSNGGGAWYPLQCDANGNLSAGSILGVTIPALSTGYLYYNSGTGLFTWAAGGGGMTWPTTPGYALWQSGTTWSTPHLTDSSGTVSSSEPFAIVQAGNQLVTGTSTNTTTSTYPASSGAVTLTFPNTSEYMVGANSDTTTTHVLHATAVPGVYNSAAIAAGDLPGTLTSGTIVPAAGITPQSIDCHTACSPTAAQLSNAQVWNYGQAASNVQVTGPTVAAGMNFLMVVGTAQGANYWRYTSTTANIYLDGGASAVTNIIFAAPAVGNSFSCFSFQTGASTYSLKCTTLAGTSTSS